MDKIWNNWWKKSKMICKDKKSLKKKKKCFWKNTKSKKQFWNKDKKDNQVDCKKNKKNLKKKNLN